MTDNQFNQAQEWFEDLRDQLLNIVSEITPDAYVTTEATNPTNISSNNK